MHVFGFNMDPTFPSKNIFILLCQKDPNPRYMRCIFDAKFLIDNNQTNMKAS